MKKRPRPKARKDDATVTLGDMINQDLFRQLKDKQLELKVAEEKRKEKEELRKREERKLKEKNKSFEELLNESGINWREFK